MSTASSARGLAAGGELDRSALSGYRYRRRRPETTALYQVVCGNLETLYAAAESGFATASLPEFVRTEFENYLDCGLLCRGAALLTCEGDKCPGVQVVALSCKGRGFCPSCLGRRMAQTAANLVEDVLPAEVPLRQWVVTFPFELRGKLGFDAKLLSAVSGVVVNVILRFYERKMRERLAPLEPVAGDAEGDATPSRPPKVQSGTVTAVQRTNSDFRLNPHLHILALDGVFVERADDSPPEFHQLPELTNVEVAEVVTTIRVKVLRLLVRRGVIEEPDEQLVLLPDELAESEPALSQLAVAAASGLPPAGPERREREPLRLARTPGAVVSGALCAADMGFTVHAATIAKRDDPKGREALCRYILRPPLAQERVQLVDSGRVRLGLKRAYSDGTVAVELDQLALMFRLAAAIPGPGFHTVRYGGILAPAAKLRALVVPAPTKKPSSAKGNEAREAEASRARWRPWIELLKRSFDVDLTCSKCGGPMKLKAFLMAPQSLNRLLTKLGEPTEAPQRAPPREPPYFVTRTERRQRHPDASPSQTELFDEPA